MTGQVLNRLGIRLSSRAYPYIQYAVELAEDDPTALFAVTERLYPAIAARFGVSPSSVEHAIRYSLERCWRSGNRAYLNEIAGYTLPYRPYTKEFLAMLTQYIKNKKVGYPGLFE